MPTIARKRLSDVVADRIREHILANDLKIGDRLPTEHQFADRLGVSRLAVREATKSLEFVGLVEASPRRGLTVGQFDLERVTPFLRLHPAIREATPTQLLDTRIVIETGGLPYTIQRMRDNPAIRAQLDAIVAQFRKEKTVAGWIELDVAFHRCLLEASGLAPLVAFNDLLQVFFLRFRESVKRVEWQEVIESHQQIIDALADGTLDEACTVLRNHIDSHRQRMEAAS